MSSETELCGIRSTVTFTDTTLVNRRADAPDYSKGPEGAAKNALGPLIIPPSPNAGRMCVVVRHVGYT
jgi:hypothetical protein